MDFTLKTYRQLLTALQNQGFVFQTFQEFLENPAQPLYPLKGKDQHTSRFYERKPPFRACPDISGESKPACRLGRGAGEKKSKTIILRHDVDKLPQNSLRFAQIQHELGIKGTYFFRIVPESPPASHGWKSGRAGFHSEIIGQIANLGHEIGYHYEDVDFAAQNFKIKDKSKKIKVEKAIADEAIKLFEKHLAEFRKLYPVKTICMHGSPRSKYDNKLLWKYYNYQDFGIIGEPYFDVNFDEVFYLTDTGRRWDGWKVSMRDKVPQQEQWKEQGLVFGITQDIIQAAEQNRLPSRIMFTFHPQRWSDNYFLWTKEFVWQNAKNVVKYFLNKVS